MRRIPDHGKGIVIVLAGSAAKRLADSLRGPNLQSREREAQLVLAAVFAAPDTARAGLDALHRDREVGRRSVLLSRFETISMSVLIETVFGWL
ncbi:hypothetical protein [Bradyrhizobium sp. AZCC 1693]|uniref:hypothetical protein n=1 Tax=Bradyrhizobium sp. AZCC 1693 TaxID=3117029 RepID=UPI002FF2D053